MKKCFYCEGTGKKMVPNDEQTFDRLFDKYCDSGIFSAGESRMKALKEVGYQRVFCETCNGTGKEEAK